MTDASVKSTPIVVLGAGSWGTALAVHLANQGNLVRLWGHNPEAIMSLNSERENKAYLPGIPFPDNLECIASLEVALEPVDGEALDVLVAVPSSVFKDLLNEMASFISNDHRILWASKGLTEEGELLHKEVINCLNNPAHYAILSGPSFAKEVAKGMPTAMTLVASSVLFESVLLERFLSPTFRIYTSQDAIGVQLGGVLKNVLAIAVGISDGMGYGANARAALMTRGLRELERLGRAMGAKSETLTGLSGSGDLILTCTDNQSRNRRFGLALGQGFDKDAAETQVGQVVEGRLNANAVHSLAVRYKIELPICSLVNHIINGELSLEQAMITLFARPIKSEN